jgi:hypothetical protein
MQLRNLAIAAAFFCAATAHADTITQVAAELDASTVLPLAPGVDLDLAGNLLNAQIAANADSLQLSINAVLKAIGLYVWPGGPTEITDEKAEPVVWTQSRIAINPNVTVSITPTSIDFGDVPITTPESSTIAFLFAGLVFAVIRPILRRKREA